MKAVLAAWAMLATIVFTAPASPQAADARTGVFNAPGERVWTVTRSTLKGMGWDVDKEARDVGWIRTDSRRLGGGDYGVYSKGAKPRLRVLIKGRDGGTA